MSVSFLAAVVGSLAALVLTGLLIRRTLQVPRADLLAWTFAAAALTIALAAQALGAYRGFTPVTFRGLQAGGRLLAPLALSWGLSETVGRRSTARFAARLVLVGLVVIGLVILMIDPLISVTFTTAWPVAGVYYNYPPIAVLEAIAGITALWAVVALIIAAVRAQRDPGWREIIPIVAAGAGAALLIEGLGFRLPIRSGYAALCLLAVLLTWFAGHRASGVRLAALHGEDRPTGDTGWQDRYRDDSGYQDYRPAPRGYGRPSVDTDFRGIYRPDPNGFARVGSDTGFNDLYRPDTGGFGGTGRDSGYGDAGGDTGYDDVGADTGYGFYRTDTDFGQLGNHHDDGPMPAVVETGDMLPVNFDVFTPPVKDDTGEQATARLYGQITIYTLIDGRADEFDRLAQAVVEKVKALEPGTLAYIVHAVPSAPLQRILYEVYRDDAAFSEHSQQPYIRDFDEDCKSLVLATNVIELGVRQAKLGPLEAPHPTPAPPAQGWGSPGQSDRPGRQAPPRREPAPGHPTAPDRGDVPGYRSAPDRGDVPGYQSAPRRSGEPRYPDPPDDDAPSHRGSPPDPRAGRYGRRQENGYR